jgi:hypothetical protein
MLESSSLEQNRELNMELRGNTLKKDTLPAGITEVLDPKVLKKGMNKTGHMKGLTHSGRE